MKIESNTQKEPPNLLFGLFDFIHLLLNNIKLLVIFLLVSLLINLFLYYQYEYNYNKSEESIVRLSTPQLATNVLAKSPLESIAINTLIEQISELQAIPDAYKAEFNFVGSSNSSKMVSALSVLKPENLFIEFFDMLTNFNEIIDDLELISNRDNNDELIERVRLSLYKSVASPNKGFFNLLETYHNDHVVTSSVENIIDRINSIKKEEAEIKYICSQIPSYYFTDGYLNPEYICNKERALVKYTDYTIIQLIIIYYYYYNFMIIYFKMY